MTDLLLSGAAAPMPAAHLEQLRSIDQTYWWHRVRWRVVRHALLHHQRRRFETYFDVGSGGGGLPGLLLRDFAFDRIVLFDAEAAPLTKVPHPRVEQRIVDLEQFDASELPPVDLITCLDTLEHLRNPDALLHELATVAQPSCLLVITVPALPALWSYWDELAHHHRRYTRQGLTELLATTGWSVRSCRYAFHAAVIPLWFRRFTQREHGSLEFPAIPKWLNSALERAFWVEYLVGAMLPWGSSVVAVATPSRSYGAASGQSRPGGGKGGNDVRD